MRLASERVCFFQLESDQRGQQMTRRSKKKKKKKKKPVRSEPTRLKAHSSLTLPAEKSGPRLSRVATAPDSREYFSLPQDHRHSQGGRPLPQPWVHVNRGPTSPDHSVRRGCPRESPASPSLVGSGRPADRLTLCPRQMTAVLRPHAPPQSPWSSTGATPAPAHQDSGPVPERKRKRRAAGNSR